MGCRPIARKAMDMAAPSSPAGSFAAEGVRTQRAISNPRAHPHRATRCLASRAVAQSQEQSSHRSIPSFFHRHRITVLAKDGTIRRRCDEETVEKQQETLTHSLHVWDRGGHEHVRRCSFAVSRGRRSHLGTVSVFQQHSGCRGELGCSAHLRHQAWQTARQNRCGCPRVPVPTLIR